MKTHRRLPIALTALATTTVAIYLVHHVFVKRTEQSESVVYVEAHASDRAATDPPLQQHIAYTTWLDTHAVETPDFEQFREITAASFTVIAAGEWDGLVAILESCGLSPNVELAESIRDRLRTRPHEYRPVNLESMTPEELLEQRTKERGEGLLYFDPTTLCLMYTPASATGETTTFIGESDIVRTVMEQGCSGRCVQAEMPFVADHVRLLESMNAAHRAHIGVRGISQSAQPVVLVLTFTHVPERGWVPRGVYTVSLGAGITFFTPRI